MIFFRKMNIIKELLNFENLKANFLLFLISFLAPIWLYYGFLWLFKYHLFLDNVYLNLLFYFWIILTALLFVLSGYLILIFFYICAKKFWYLIFLVYFAQMTICYFYSLKLLFELYSLQFQS